MNYEDMEIVFISSGATSEEISLEVGEDEE